MKKLILVTSLISSICFSQETTYQINGIVSYFEDQFFEAEDGVYYFNLNESALCYFPKNGSTGWRKTVQYNASDNFNSASISQCHLSNHLIVSMNSSYADKTLIIKYDLDGNLVWSKLIDYGISNTLDYGSNATPLVINDLDEILVSTTLYDRLLFSKLNSNGDLIFSKRVNSEDYIDSGEKNPGFSLVCTEDNGYLITMKNGNNPTISKLDSNLQIEWSKKWSIDGYSHPKLALTLLSGNYCIIGSGDYGTYIAEVDSEGNLLSYRYNQFGLTFPKHFRYINDESLTIIDQYGGTANVNLIDNSIHRSIYLNQSSSVDVHNQHLNFIDLDYGYLYLDVESNQSNCLYPSKDSSFLQYQTINPGTVENETLVISNQGTIQDYSISSYTYNDIFLNIGCNNLNLDSKEDLDLIIYPNPSNNENIIQFANGSSKIHSLEILNSKGEIVKNINFTEVNQTFSMFDQPTGIYFVKAFDKGSNFIATKKLIIE